MYCGQEVSNKSFLNWRKIDKNNKTLLELSTKSADGLRKLQQNEPDHLKKSQTPSVKGEVRPDIEKSQLLSCYITFSLYRYTATTIT